jgi:uncharacterized protein YuzB (UPF0349 family)
MSGQCKNDLQRPELEPDPKILISNYGCGRSCDLCGSGSGSAMLLYNSSNKKRLKFSIFVN